MPFFIFGFLHNIIQYKVTDYIIPKLSTDIEYYAPFAVFLGLFFYPLFYLGFLTFAYYFLDFNWWMLLLYLILMPISGFFAYWFMVYMRHINNKWQYIFLLTDRKELLKDMRAEKQQLIKILFD